jgi:hypothetical protein
MRIRGSMVPATDGRSGLRTGFATGWYGPGMSVARARLWPLTGAAIAAVALVAACLPPPRVASETVAPVGSAAVGSPSAVVPPPSVAPEAHDVAVAAFAKQVASGKLTYHIAFTGDLRASVDRLPIAGQMDVAGTDFATNFTYDFEPDYPGAGKVRVQVRGVGGKGWIKRGSTSWKALKTFGFEQSYVPFKTVKAATDVKYLGPVKVGGKTYHKIAVLDALLIHPNTVPYQIQKEVVKDTHLEVVIDDAGLPRSGTWTLRGQARIGAGDGQLQNVVYDLALTFSKVGSRISVKRP